jgi:hypothetical protein
MADIASGAASGAAAGSVAGPYGALVGGVLGATGLLGGGSKSSGGSSGAAALPISTTQTNRQDVAIDLTVDNNLVGAPININIGGQQQADGSLGAGQNYRDRGVDEPRLYAPFGTMQDVQTATRTEPVIWDGKNVCPLPRSFYPSDSPCSRGDEFLLPGQGAQPATMFDQYRRPILIAGGVALAGVGILVLRRKHVR